MYRTAEDYRRYTVGNAGRLNAMFQLYRRFRRYFGPRVLDLGCGGGVLAGVLGKSVVSYVGVDGNPDMIKAARDTAAGSDPRARFVMGDVARARVAGRFDTVALLGNTLGHLDVAAMDELLRRRAANVRPGATLLVDYRDLVAMFWNGTWSRVNIQTHIRGRVVHRVTRLDLQSGRLEMRGRPASRAWTLDWYHAIWSPFILEAVMRARGWRLVTRSEMSTGKSKPTPEHYIDVYRLA